MLRAVTHDFEFESIEWTQVEGGAVTVERAKSSVAAFMAPAVDVSSEFLFRVTATDSVGEQVSADLKVSVQPITQFEVGFPVDKGVYPGSILNVTGIAHVPSVSSDDLTVEVIIGDVVFSGTVGESGRWIVAGIDISDFEEDVDIGVSLRRDEERLSYRAVSFKRSVDVLGFGSIYQIPDGTYLTPAFNKIDPVSYTSEPIALEEYSGYVEYIRSSEYLGFSDDGTKAIAFRPSRNSIYYIDHALRKVTFRTMSSFTGYPANNVLTAGAAFIDFDHILVSDCRVSAIYKMDLVAQSFSLFADTEGLFGDGDCLKNFIYDQARDSLIGFSDRDVYSLRLSDLAVTEISSNNRGAGEPLGYHRGIVKSPDSNNLLLLGSRLVSVDIATGDRSYPLPLTTNEGLTTSDVWGAIILEDDSLLLSSPSNVHLFKFDFTSSQASTLQSGTTGNGVRTGDIHRLAVSADQKNLLLSSSDGIFSLNLSTNHITNLRYIDGLTVHRAIVDEFSGQSVIFTGCSGSSVCRLDKDSGTVSAHLFVSREELPFARGTLGYISDVETGAMYAIGNDSEYYSTVIQFDFDSMAFTSVNVRDGVSGVLRVKGVALDKRQNTTYVVTSKDIRTLDLETGYTRVIYQSDGSLYDFAMGESTVYFNTNSAPGGFWSLDLNSGEVDILSGNGWGQGPVPTAGDMAVDERMNRMFVTTTYDHLVVIDLVTGDRMFVALD